MTLVYFTILENGYSFVVNYLSASNGCSQVTASTNIDLNCMFDHLLPALA